MLLYLLEFDGWAHLGGPAVTTKGMGMKVVARVEGPLDWIVRWSWEGGDGLIRTSLSLLSYIVLVSVNS
jgi:hypothetical protein